MLPPPPVLSGVTFCALSETLSTAATIVAVVVNPIWGVGAFILDKVLKNPLGQVLTFEYRVTGTWTKPEVAPLKAEVRNTDPAQQQSPQ